MNSVYDYVIVGAGSAGCVLAARLSEDPRRPVALLEAGAEDTQPEIHIPAAFPALFKSSSDWDLLGEPEPGLDNRRLYLPRGQGARRVQLDQRDDLRPRQPRRLRRLGRGRREGWSYDDVLPYFKRSEDNERGEDAFHGAGGPMSVSDSRSMQPADRHDARGGACSAGHEHNPDFNGARQEGVGRFQLTQRDGRR